MRALGVQHEYLRVNAWGDTMALGHPLGAMTVNCLHTTGGCYALCTMCFGVSLGIAVILKQV